MILTSRAPGCRHHSAVAPHSWFNHWTRGLFEIDVDPDHKGGRSAHIVRKHAAMASGEQEGGTLVKCLRSTLAWRCVWEETMSGRESLKSGKLLYEVSTYTLQSALPSTAAIPPLGRKGY